MIVDDLCDPTIRSDGRGPGGRNKLTRDLLGDKKRYGEFLTSPKHIHTNILADGLKRLGREGLVTTAPYSLHPVSRISPYGKGSRAWTCGGGSGRVGRRVRSCGRA